jgi:hypothetical protein
MLLVTPTISIHSGCEGIGFADSLPEGAFARPVILGHGRIDDGHGGPAESVRVGELPPLQEAHPVSLEIARRDVIRIRERLLA